MAIKKCPICKKGYENVSLLALHLETDHGDEIPKDWSGGKYYFNSLHGRTTGKCVICKQDTQFDEKTYKTKRLCESPTCRKKYIENFKNNMRRTGKENQMKDPNHQKKMLQGRSIAKNYKWSTSGESVCIGSYEYDFARFCDVFLGLTSDNVIFPAPMTIEYMYNGEKHFYIPDVYIINLNLIVEIKDGGDNPNTHPKILAVDKQKEKAKEQALKNYNYNYIKVADKKYSKFLELFKKLQNMDNISQPGTYKPFIMIDESVLLDEMCSNIVTTHIIEKCDVDIIPCLSYRIDALRIDDYIFYVIDSTLYKINKNKVAFYKGEQILALKGLSDYDKTNILNNLLTSVGKKFVLPEIESKDTAEYIVRAVYNIKGSVSGKENYNTLTFNEIIPVKENDVVLSDIMNDLRKENNVDNNELLDESFGTITMYHGSVEKMKEIKPLGFDLGNALQGPGWSTFCWRDKEKARCWACYQLVRKLRKDHHDKDIEVIWDFRNMLVMATSESIDKIKDRYLGFKTYVYTLEVPMNKVSVGNDSTQDEYTIRVETKPTHVETIIFTEELLQKYFRSASIEEIDTFGKEYFDGKYLGNRGFIKSLLITNDYSDNVSNKLVQTVSKAIKNNELKPGDDLNKFFKNNNLKLNKTYPIKRTKQFLFRESTDGVNIESELNSLNEMATKIKRHQNVNNIELSEAMMKSTNLLNHNIEDWTEGTKKVLFITGLSGSGKSTLAREYAEKYNAIHIEMDLIEQGKKSYLYDDLCNSLPFYKTWAKDSKEMKFEDYCTKMDNIIKTSIVLLKNKEGKFILEGIQFYYYGQKTELKSEPIIVINSSILKSVKQRLKRNMSKGKKIKTNDLIPMLRWYMNDDKRKDDFIKEVITECTSTYTTISENFDYLSEDTDERKVTLYHGSNLRLDEILPTSLNIGTKESGSRNSSFWVHGDNIDYAYTYAVLRAIKSQNEDVAYAFDYKGKIVSKSRLVIDEKYKDVIENSVHGYIYNKEFDVKDIGKGHDINIPELTIDKNVIPDGCREISFKDVKHMVKFKPVEYIEKIKEGVKKGTIKTETVFKNDPLKNIVTCPDEGTKRYENPLEENTIFDDDNLYFNFDKWGTKDHNILFVTGLSGSGKTTLGEYYEKKYKNTHLFELDGLEFGYDSSNRGILDKVKKIYPEYKKLVENKNTKFNEHREVLMNAIVKAIQIMFKDEKTLYIVEGIQLYGFFKANIFSSEPIIIRGTSVVNSNINRIKRNYNKPSDIFKCIGELSNFKYLLRDDKILDKFKKDLKKDKVINESTDPIIEVLKENRLLFNELANVKYTEIGDLEFNRKLAENEYCVTFDDKYNNILSRMEKERKDNFISVELLEERENYIRELDENTSLEEMAYLGMVTSLNDY